MAKTKKRAKPPEALESLRRMVVVDGGEILRAYGDPVSGRWQLLAALPIDVVRFQRGGDPKLDETVAKMLVSAKTFDAAKIKPDQAAAASGPPGD